MKEHPWFKGVREHRWTREQIVRAEMQHYLRVRMNPIFLGYIVTNVASERNYELMDVVMENFMEELGGDKTHVDVMLQFLEEGGITREQADRADPAPGTLAAIEMIRSGCQNRTALEGVALLAYVEAMHGGPDGAAARVFKELVGHYGFSRRAAATYELHAEQDTGHGDRQIDMIRRLKHEYGLETMAHLSCVGETVDGLVDILDVGLRSAYVASWHAAPLMAARKNGLIAFTSSFGASCYMHGPGYGAQKVGVDKFAKDMAVDLKAFNVAAVSIWVYKSGYVRPGLGEPVTTSFYGRDVPGRSVVGPWAEALSTFVGRNLRLVQAE